jgi:endoglucanase
MKIYFCQIILILLFSISLRAQSTESLIRLNQLGYYPHAPKIAAVVGETGSGDFYVMGTERGDTVYKGRLGDLMQSKNSSLRTRIADFSSVQQSGSYVILIPRLSSSYRFRISPKIHSTLAVSSLKAFYYQRASMPLDSLYAGKWARPAGHPGSSFRRLPDAAGGHSHCQSRRLV